MNRDVPDFALVFGNPARREGWMCRCGLRLRDDGALQCATCGASYVLHAGELSVQPA